METEVVPPMSTASLPGQYPLINPNPGFAPVPRPDGLNHVSGMRRRSSVQQGRALEILGHAVEYLVDSRMFLIDQPTTRADAEATQILMLLSREVFFECAEVVPPARRLGHWIAGKLAVAGNC
jgi:hypothetical protein